MLFISLVPSLTYERKLYQPGEIFEILPEDRAWKAYGLSKDITDEELKSRFRGEQLFRLPTDDEIKKFYGEGTIELDQMSEKQRKVIKATVRAKAAEMRVLSEEMQKEAVAEDEEVEEEEEKKKK